MVDIFTKNSAEKSKESSSNIEQQDKQSTSFEKSQETSRVVVETVRDGVESAEVMTNGEVGEELKENKKVFADGSGSGSSATAQALLAKQVRIPTVAVMRKQVAIEIKKEIRVLEQEARKIIRNPTKFSPFTLNGVVSKIRELKDILGQLAYATFENIKGWWIKYVRGTTI